mmetsp:Transcript_11147/g.26045  ORF Transcript_11147/g.26045 Transcript_11147/m.26045 type:complete len:208 (-) Transcript_11147:89-712(-)
MGGGEDAAHAKIAELERHERVVLVEHDVLALEVAMENAVCVHVRECGHELEERGHYLVLRDEATALLLGDRPPPRREPLRERARVCILHDDTQNALTAAPLDVGTVVCDHVGVIEPAEAGHLHPERVRAGLGRERDLLHAVHPSRCLRLDEEGLARRAAADAADLAQRAQQRRPRCKVVVGHDPQLSSSQLGVAPQRCSSAARRNSV